MLVEFIHTNIKEVGAGVALISALVGVVAWLRKERIKKKNRYDLSDFFVEENDPYKYKVNYIPTQCVDRPPDEEDEIAESYETANRQKLIDFFLKQVFTNNSKKMYLVLGGAGIGKTTFMINLFLKYNSIPGLTRKYRIKYIPLGDPSADGFIEKYKADGSEYVDGSNTILLLDAFDEDPKALENHEERINEIVNATRTFRKVIITSRTQFFPEEEKEGFSLTIPIQGKQLTYKKFIKKYIAPFSDKEVEFYLNKKFGGIFRCVVLNPDRIKAEIIISKASNLVVRPMVMEFVDLLLEDSREYLYDHEVYEHIIESWISREKVKLNEHQKFAIDMYQFMSQAALKVYENYRKGEGLYIDLSEAVEIAITHSLNLDEIDLSTRSLLNRNTKGRLKFSHKSILEFFLAKHDVNAKRRNQTLNLESFEFAKKIRRSILLFEILQGATQLFAILFDKNNNIALGFAPVKITGRNMYPRGYSEHGYSILALNLDNSKINKLRTFNAKRILVLNGEKEFDADLIQIKSVGPGPSNGRYQLCIQIMEDTRNIYVRRFKESGLMKSQFFDTRPSTIVECSFIDDDWEIEPNFSRSYPMSR